jgi:ATP-dependent Clp endopeptidase proteolytic subunit ClpP
VSAKDFAKALDSLPDDTSEIRLHINSPGGEVYEGLAILNSLRQHKARVVAVVDGLAASAASFIAAGADELVMSGNSQLMIHDAWGLCVGNAADMRDLADRLDKISANIASIYAARAPKGDWRAAMLAESWFDADEAVTVGLADRVEGVVDEKAKNRFDLSIFQHAGREDAPTPSIPLATEPEPVAEPTEPAGMSALQERRHRMNARRFSAA